MGFFSQIVSESRRSAVGFIGPAPATVEQAPASAAATMSPDVDAQGMHGRIRSHTTSNSVLPEPQFATSTRVAEVSAPVSETKLEKMALPVAGRKNRTASAAPVVTAETSPINSVPAPGGKSELEPNSGTSVQAALQQKATGVAESQTPSTELSPKRQIKKAAPTKKQAAEIRSKTHGVAKASNRETVNRETVNLETGLLQDQEHPMDGAGVAAEITDHRNSQHPTQNSPEARASHNTQAAAPVYSGPQLQTAPMAALPKIAQRPYSPPQVSVSAPQVRIGQINVVVEGKSPKSPPAAVREQDSSSRLFLRGL